MQCERPVYHEPVLADCHILKTVLAHSGHATCNRTLLAWEWMVLD
jgi:hypothetical protein